MQLRRGAPVRGTRVLGPAALAQTLAVVAAWAIPALAEPPPDAPIANSMFRYFTGSDHIGVRSLMGDYTMPVFQSSALTLHWNNEQVRIPAISAPAGTQEAIDAITTASRPIAGNAFQDFVKVRNEFQGGIHAEHRSVDYYLSTESDYLGQQVTAKVDRDVRDDLLNLAVGTSVGWDAIRPAEDSDTNSDDDKKTTLHCNLVATRIMAPTTVVRAGFEYNIVHGLQHNPYRNVYAGGTNVPERHPDARQRRDLFVKLNQYLSNRSSLKLNYRLYNDDWGITSHEIGSNINQYITQGVFVRWDYRYYTQTSADFYRPEYPTVDGIGGYRTGDYRMGVLSSHLFGAAVNVDLADLITDHDWWRRLGLSVNYERYFNNNNYSANIVETSLDFRF